MNKHAVRQTAASTTLSRDCTGGRLPDFTDASLLVLLFIQRSKVLFPFLHAALACPHRSRCRIVASPALLPYALTKFNRYTQLCA